MKELPKPVAALVDQLSEMPGVGAVALGGSHALGIADAASDFDLGLYYRGTLDLTALSAHGTVHPPGSWGRLMNGGAWLRIDGLRVDVLLRDLDTVEYWARRAEEGEFEVDALLGYMAGAPTYMLAAELASCRVLRGTLPKQGYPETLSTVAPPRWRIHRTVSLDYARVHAKRGNLAGAVGQAAKAAVEEAHAVLCERKAWVCNEKRMIETAGLDEVQTLFGQIPSGRSGLREWLDRVASCLGVLKGEASPWVA